MLMMLALRLAGIRPIALGRTATLLCVQNTRKGEREFEKLSFQLMLMMLALCCDWNPSN